MSRIFEILKAYPINLSYLVNYLKDTGWSIQEHKNKQFQRFSQELSSGKSIVIILPKDNKSIDINHRISDAIETLALYEDKKPLDVINSIVEVHSDILNIQLSKGTDITSIKFDDAINVIESIRRLILYSASSEQRPNTYFARPLSKAKQFMVDCKFGHTSRGSFGFTIESPVDSRSALASPFSRRVIERIIKGLNDVQEAVFDEDTVVRNSDEGLNANMCSALLQIMSCSRGNVECSVKWSPEVEVSGNINQISNISLDPNAMEYLQYAYAKLLPRDDSKPVTIKGKVIMMKAESIYEEEAESGEPPHTIILESEYNGRIIRIHMTLNASDYLNACESHMNEKFVEISGYLTKNGNKWILTSPHEFHISGGHVPKVKEKDNDESVQRTFGEWI